MQQNPTHFQINSMFNTIDVWEVMLHNWLDKSATEKFVASIFRVADYSGATNRQKKL